MIRSVSTNKDSAEAVPRAASASSSAGPSLRLRNLCVFALVAAFWLAFDQVVKIQCEAYATGATICPDFLILFDLRLVHNFGAAWSMFEGSVALLIAVAVVICLLLFAFAVYESKNASLLEMASIALVFAGGLGNMIDRIAYGYVVDMLDLQLFDFPTFNIADIGVTCGIVLLFISILLQAKGADRDA